MWCAVTAVAGCGRVGFTHGGPDGGTLQSSVMTLGDLGDDLPKAIIATSDGNLLLGGQFRGSVDPGCAPMTAVGGADGFLLELTPALGCVRTWTIGGMGDDLVTTMTEDRAGNFVVGGEFRMTSTMQSGPALMATFDRDIFLTKLTPTWTNVWAHQLPGNSNDATYDLIDRVATDSIDDVYVFGRIWGTAEQFGWGGVTNTFTDNGWGDALIVHVAADGGYVGADSFGGGGSEQTYALVIDDQDNAYYGGGYRGTADFDPGPAVLDDSGNFDGFVLQRKPDDSLGWASIEQNGAWRPYQGLGLEPGGRLAAVQDDLYSVMPAAVIRTQSLNLADGSVVWSREITATTVYAFALATDTDGNVYVGGKYQGTVDFDPMGGGDMRTAAGGNDCWVQRYDMNGTLAWTVTFGGTGDDEIDSIAARGVDDIALLGQFHDAVDFGSEGAPDVRLSNGAADIFVRRLTR